MPIAKQCPCASAKTGQPNAPETLTLAWPPEIDSGKNRYDSPARGRLYDDPAGQACKEISMKSQGRGKESVCPASVSKDIAGEGIKVHIEVRAVAVAGNEQAIPGMGGFVRDIDELGPVIWKLDPHRLVGRAERFGDIDRLVCTRYPGHILIEPVLNFMLEDKKYPRHTRDEKNRRNEEARPEMPAPHGAKERAFH